MPVILIVVAYLIFENTRPSHAYILLNNLFYLIFKKHVRFTHVHSTSLMKYPDTFKKPIEKYSNKDMHVLSMVIRTWCTSPS